MQKAHDVVQLAVLVAILAVLVGIAVHLIQPRSVSPETFKLPVGAPQTPRGAQTFDDGRRPVGAQIDRWGVGSQK